MVLEIWRWGGGDEGMYSSAPQVSSKIGYECSSYFAWRFSSQLLSGRGGDVR